MAVIIDGSNTPTLGGIGYGDGSELAFSAAGTAGQVLTSAGGAAPTWTTPSAGAMNFITSVTASNSATVDVENAMTAYDVYMIVADQIITTSVANPNFACQLKIGGAYQTSAAYQYHSTTNLANSATYNAFASDSAANIRMTNNLTAPSAVSFVMYIFKPSNATTYKFISWMGAAYASIGIVQINAISGSATYTANLSAITGVRFFTSTNNITSGTFRLYGISNS